MENVKKLVAEVIEALYNPHGLFTKEEMTAEYTEQIEQKDAQCLINHLKYCKCTELYTRVEEATKQGKIIKNSNGSEYEILAQKGSYTLLQRTTRGFSRYVVAWCLNEYESGYCWGQGHYFETLENAQEYFDKQ